MTPERWEHIDRILEAALNQPPEMRAAFLDSMCSGDQAARDEIESLISDQERHSSFLETPPYDLIFDMEPRTGKLLGSYKIEEELGHGAMGQVYLAHDMKLDRKVAIKFLASEMEAGERTGRLMIEAKAAARLDHPCICSIHEVVDVDDDGFIVMQYIEGENLASRIRRGALTVSQSMDFALQIADALSEAHSHGIVHRDIKPLNVMITTQDQVKVLDFGIAKVIGVNEFDLRDVQSHRLASAPGVIAGTPAYMSPEQATGAMVDTRSDLFSLGVVMYECVTGVVPFSGGNVAKVFQKIINVDPRSPSYLNPAVPPKLTRVILKALAKNPDSRYQSAADLRADLLLVRADADRRTRAADRFARLFNSSTVRGRSTIAAALTILALSVVVAPRVIPLVSSFFRAVKTEAQPPPLPTPNAGAQQLYEQGMEALRAGSYHTASQRFRESLEIDGDFVFAHAHLAEAYSELSHVDRAEKEWLTVQGLIRNRSLSRLDELRLETIGHIIDFEFLQTVESYRKIAEEVPEAEQANAYFDLGRGYERTGNMKAANDNYQSAGDRDPTNAAIFLRLAALCEEQQQASTGYLDSAERLYRQQGSDEGLTEVIYQRAVLYRRFGRSRDAEAALQQAKSMAERTGNYYQRFKVMLELSRLVNDRKDKRAAKDYAKTAAESLGGVDGLRINALIDVGDVLLDLGEYDDAKTTFFNVLKLAASEGNATEARAKLSMGTVYLQQHDTDRAIPLLEEARHAFSLLGDTVGEWEASSRLGDVRDLAGDYDEAHRVHQQALELAQSSNDAHRIAQSQEDIGFVCAHQERIPEALQWFEQSSERFVIEGNPIRTANAFINIADMCWRLGKYEDAGRHLRRAEEEMALIIPSSSQLLAKLPRVEAQMRLSEERFAQSIIAANDALRLNAGSGHIAEVKATYGMALSLDGQRSLGLSECERALVEAKSWMLGTARLAVAEARLQNGDARHCLAVSLDAWQAFRDSGQTDSEWRALLIAAKASHKLGNVARTEEYASRARVVQSSLEVKWGVENYRSYLTRPDIRSASADLAHLLDTQK